MSLSFQEFVFTAKDSLTAFDAWVGKFSPLATADHLCYKCSSHDEFEKIRSWLEEETAFIYQSIISQRRIVVAKFLAPFKTALGDIWYLELSDQKPDGSQGGGFDHVEIYPTHSSVVELVTKLSARGFVLTKADRPHHMTFDGELESGLKIRLEPGPLIEKIKRGEMK
jgi:hypothetical protein